jgi:anti-sigma factor RsiW
MPTLAFELLDGALDAAGRASLATHLDACPACRARVEHDRRFLAALRRRRPAVAAPPSLRARALALGAAFRDGA